MRTTNRRRSPEEAFPSADRFSRRVPAGAVILGVVAFLVLAAAGCRAHPISLVTMVVGDAVNDADVKDRRDLLMGKPETAADSMFGARQETLVDVDRPGVSLIFYPVKGDLLKSSRYIVEVENGAIVVFTKTKQNIDGVEDLIHNASLEKKLIGKAPAACSAEGKLGVPLRTLRSREKDQLLRVYDVRNWSDFMGARYCVLRFDSRDLCESVALIGVSASTSKDPIRR
ncbi:MAG TPA: hypothetical protein VFH53_10105 [Phycisphaerae bacterium]|nr:hypothetical protein [Phycisphaerae bacterium]